MSHLEGCRNWWQGTEAVRAGGPGRGRWAETILHGSVLRLWREAVELVIPESPLKSWEPPCPGFICKGG